MATAPPRIVRHRCPHGAWENERAGATPAEYLRRLLPEGGGGAAG